MSETAKVPQVSVLMPVYNGALYLREAVDSILNQTFIDFEFIIVDDGSTDETSAILDGYTDPRIVRVTNQNNLGIIEALNRGLAVACGKYVARMDADDISLPERLSQQVQFLEEHPEIGILGTGIIEMDDSKVWRSCRPVYPAVVRWHLFFYTCISHPTMMVRRAIYEQLGGYGPTFTHAEDLDFLLRAAFEHKVANLPSHLLRYRRHPTAIGRTYHEPQVRNAILTTRQALTRFLGEEVSFEVVASLNCHRRHQERMVSPEEALEATAFLLHLYRVYIGIVSPTKIEKRKIGYHVLMRLTALRKKGATTGQLKDRVKLWRAWVSACLGISRGLLSVAGIVRVGQILFKWYVYPGKKV